MNDLIKPARRIIGFTGTRHGMKPRQKQALRERVSRLLDQIDAHGGSIVMPALMAEHGDCVGADAEFHEICVSLGIACGIRPGSFDNLRAYCDGILLERPKHPMARNADIVADADILFGCPDTFSPQKGSGTWATIGMAMKKGITVVTIFRDGSVKQWRPPASPPGPQQLSLDIGRGTP